MDRNEDSIDLSRLFHIMCDHKPAIFCIVGICTLLAIVISFLLPKQYESTTLVQTRAATKMDISGAAGAMAALGLGGLGGGERCLAHDELHRADEVAYGTRPHYRQFELRRRKTHSKGFC